MKSLLTNESVDANGTDQAGVRWYELRDPNGSPFIYQQGTYAPDSDNRWMGSIAMDRDGNIAVGYSVSSSTTFPSIRYAGRLATDPLGQIGPGRSHPDRGHRLADQHSRPLGRLQQYDDRPMR